MRKTKNFLFKAIFGSAIFCVAFVFLLGAKEVQAATVHYYVDPAGTNDGSHGNGSGTDAWATIAYALANVANPTTDTIIINIAAGTYVQNNVDLLINRSFLDLTLQGAGANSTFIQSAATAGASSSRVIYIGGNQTVRINDVTVRYGRSESGSGIYQGSTTTTLYLNRCVIDDNVNSTWGGGGVLSYGNLYMESCLISNNGCGDVQCGGGLYVQHYNHPELIAQVNNSTFYKNDSGGGSISLSLDAHFIITNSTVYQGDVDGHGIYNCNNDVYIYIKNTLVTDPTGYDYALDLDYGYSYSNKPEIFDGGYNYIETQTGGAKYTFVDGDNGNIVGINENLNLSTTLADNGVTNGVQTLALNENSVAINAGDDAAHGPAGNQVTPSGHDQRVKYRNGAVDIGAFEYNGYDGPGDIPEPTGQASSVAFSNVAYGTADLSWSGGNGEKRIVFVKAGSSGTATPVDQTYYNVDSAFGNGDQIESTGWYAVYRGTGTSVSLTGLTPSTDYIAQVFEFNGTSNIENYLTSTASNNPNTTTTLAASEPTTQAHSISFSSVDYNTMTVSWTRGDGENVAVFAKAGSSGTATPVDQTTYTASATFGSGTQIDASGWYCIYNGTGTSVDVTGLTAETGYLFQAFEYNASGGYENYFTSSADNNPTTQATLTVATPTTQAHSLSFSSVDYTQMDVSWTNGNGAKRVVFAKVGSSGTASVADDTAYSANATFGSGNQIDASGWYAVYNGTGTSVTVTGLTVGTDYIFQVFEYNENGSIKTYFTDSASDNPKSQVSLSVEKPATQSSGVNFSSVESTSLDVSWTRGDGENVAVFVKAGSSGTATPVDQTTYTASTTFGSGTQIGTSGWYCVYKGTGTSVSLSGLSAETSYIVQAFELNGPNGAEDYLIDTATNNPATQATTSAPTEIEIGSGTSVTSTSGPAPVNIWYRSLHGQSVYTAAEINTAGASGPLSITQIGFYVAGAPANALPNFVIRMKHTSDSDVSSWQSSSGMTTVYSTTSYAPTAGGFDMITLDEPFLWNGTDNLVVDTAFGIVGYSQSGLVRYYSSTNGYRYARSDSSDQTNNFSGGSVTSTKPQLKIAFGDITAPTITAVSSDKANGSYKEGEVIDIDVTFSEAVSSTGDVTITLETGEIDRTCSFSVSNSTTGTCNYTVQAGDVSVDLNVISISGTITDSSNNAMTDFSPTTNLATNKALVIDTTAPETPVADPVAGTYQSVQSVSLLAGGAGAIYYTINGDEPTTSSTLYSSAIAVGSSQTIKALAVDTAGNESSILEATYVIILDSSDPEISHVSASASSESATITWTTNESASSQVQYGLVSSYGSQTSETDISPRVTSHSVTLNNLKTCARYYYRVKSTDASSNQGVSAQSAFNTSGCTVSSITDGSSEAVETSGGTVSHSTSDGTATVTAPNGYSSQNATIQINKLNTTTAPTPPSQATVVGDNFFELKAILDNGTVLEAFDQAVTFTVSYGSETESSYVESTLDVYKYENGSWVARNCTLDADANTLTCSLESFSTYGVLGETVGEETEEDEEAEKARIDSWKAYRYEKIETDCPERLRLVIKGKNFSSSARVEIGGKKAYEVKKKSNNKLEARFCLTDLLKKKTALKRSIKVINPEADEEKADKKIDLGDLNSQFKRADFIASNPQRITNLQQALFELGFLSEQYVTGFYGPITQEAIRRFQIKHGLPVTGQFHLDSLNKLLDELD